MDAGVRWETTVDVFPVTFQTHFKLSYIRVINTYMYVYICLLLPILQEQKGISNTLW